MVATDDLSWAEMAGDIEGSRFENLVFPTRLGAKTSTIMLASSARKASISKLCGMR